MKIGSAMHSALAGIHKGLRGLERNAAEVAAAAGNPEESVPVKPLVESKIHQRQVEANAKVLETADEMIGSLFDEKA